MENTLKLFAQWNLEQPEQRKALFVHGSHKWYEEEIVYMICCWDYVYRPTDKKAEGLYEVFLKPQAPILVYAYQIHMSDSRKLLTNPKIKAKIQGSKEEIVLSLQKTGGLKAGGAGNYNLMTKAIELTLPDAVYKVGKDAELVNLVKSGTQGKKATKSALDILTNYVAKYWGAGIKDLGLT